MRIAQVAPLWESVPPSGYGAIEMIVADLATGMEQRGHHVTVFAAGDSQVAGNLAAIHPRALNADVNVKEPEPYRFLQAVHVADRSTEFDVIHSHVHSNSGCLMVPMLHGLSTPVVHTIHCYFNQDNSRLFERFASDRYVAISESQRKGLPDLNYLGTVHHGLDVTAFPYIDRPQDPPYLAFLGRIRWEKGVHTAIDIARRVGLPLKLAGRVKGQDRDFFENYVVPHVDGNNVEFVGELDTRYKAAFLGGAVATLSVPCIPEPFGLVSIESMACGTPVVALSNGAACEIVRDGRTGFVGDTADELVDAVQRIGKIDRLGCRAHVAERFSVAHMVDQYESVFDSVTRSRLRRPKSPATAAG